MDALKKKTQVQKENINYIQRKELLEKKGKRNIITQRDTQRETERKN